MKKVRIFIILTHIIKKEEKMFFAHCPELDVGSQGETIEDAENNLKDAIVLYLDTIEELGIREDVFKKRKIKMYSSKPKPSFRKINIPRSYNNFPYITLDAMALA